MVTAAEIQLANILSAIVTVRDALINKENSILARCASRSVANGVKALSNTADIIGMNQFAGIRIRFRDLHGKYDAMMTNYCRVTTPANRV